jgi:hypothetical protein
MDIPGRLCSGAQGENNSGVVQSPFFDLICGWPPYSPDLNPMDYSVWSILEAMACAKPQRSLEPLKQSLLRDWDRISAEKVWCVAENFTRRLKLCIRAKGSHLQNLNMLYT